MRQIFRPSEFARKGWSGEKCPNTRPGIIISKSTQKINAPKPGRKKIEKTSTTLLNAAGRAAGNHHEPGGA
jgi:hypothetical protein